MEAFWSMKNHTQGINAFQEPSQAVNELLLLLLLLLFRASAADSWTLTSTKLLFDLRSVFVAAVKDEERIRFSEEILLVQLVATELQHHWFLTREEENTGLIQRGAVVWMWMIMGTETCKNWDVIFGLEAMEADMTKFFQGKLETHEI